MPRLSTSWLGYWLLSTQNFWIARACKGDQGRALAEKNPRKYLPTKVRQQTNNKVILSFITPKSSVAPFYILHLAILWSLPCPRVFFALLFQQHGSPFFPTQWNRPAGSRAVVRPDWWGIRSTQLPSWSWPGRNCRCRDHTGPPSKGGQPGANLWFLQNQKILQWCIWMEYNWWFSCHNRLCTEPNLAGQIWSGASFYGLCLILIPAEVVSTHRGTYATCVT